ncbi:hypothetical protein R1sor_024647 [Riccia sorocarpa]|uniref:Amino acid transporter transmembrane domain-containing protein n=1 Tax=Riccia sorocarpa TaxID=122646 RepID=A0ABD3GSZ4_9MARC
MTVINPNQVASALQSRPSSKVVSALRPNDHEQAPLLPSGSTCPRGHPLSSVKKTFGNIVISVVGAGVLGLPYTLKVSGWLAGLITLMIVAVACYYTMMLLVQCKRKVESSEVDWVETYSDLGLLTYGKAGQFAVDLMIVLSQGGFCVGYLIFIGENLATVFYPANHVDNSGINKMTSLSGATRVDGGVYSVDGIISSVGLAWAGWSGKSVYIWIIFPLQLALATIRSLTRLAPFSIFADVANFSAMLFVMSVDVIDFRERGIGNVSAFTGLSTLPFVVGVAIYAFEGFGLVLPLESNMKNRSKFGPTLAWAMAFIAFVYTTFAILGYLAFGDTTRDIVTLNLGDTWMTAVVKVALCIGLFFTFPVMMHPVHEVFERRIMGNDSYVIRAFTIIVVTWLAVAVPRFGDFLSLVGNSVCSILSFVMPAVIHLHVFADDIGWSQYTIDCLFIVFGMFFGAPISRQLHGSQEGHPSGRNWSRVCGHLAGCNSSVSVQQTSFFCSIDDSRGNQYAFGLLVDENLFASQAGRGNYNGDLLLTQ